MKKLSIITILLGKEEKILERVGYLIKSLEKIYNKYENEIELIFIIEGKKWKKHPQIQMLNTIFPTSKIIYKEEVESLPSKLFNIGIKESKGNYLMFNYPGCYNFIKQLDCFFEEEENSEIYYFKNLNENNPNLLFTGNNEIELLYHERLYGLNNYIYSKEIIIKLGCFNESRILQKEFDIDFFIKILENDFIIETLDYEIEAKNFLNYPFEEDFKIKKDIINRFLVRCQNMRDKNFEEIEETFYNDLNENELENLKHFFSNNLIEKVNTKYNEKYKITVLGGPWEYHHNKICFFNYFDKLVGQGFCTYKFNLDYLTEESDLLNSDLVIFTRIKSEKGKDLIDFCNKKKIPSIYMLDDNWISIVKDYPEYGKIFEKGSNLYDNFMYILQNSTITWVYNDNLAEDLKDFSKKILKAKLGVDVKPIQEREKREKLIIGFAGSMRYDDKAFKALSMIERNDIIILLFGVMNEKQLKMFENIEIIREEFLKYEKYIEKMREIQPDLLIAPLDFNRTNSSKCYNKYLENSSIKAATIFSKVPPYTYIVKENITGFYTQEETVEGWYNTIKKVLDDRELLLRVKENSYKDVMDNYSVDKLMEWFIFTIKQIIQEGV